MDVQSLQERVAKIASKRELLVRLSTDPNIGDLSIDVSQALIEMDDLLAEFQKTFPNDTESVADGEIQAN
jgi:ferric-dicitrate binding protein FerR (iron transport regulator)